MPCCFGLLNLANSFVRNHDEICRTSAILHDEKSNRLSYSNEMHGGGRGKEGF